MKKGRKLGRRRERIRVRREESGMKQGRYQDEEGQRSCRRRAEIRAKKGRD
jgi:hypothetical protein